MFGHLCVCELLSGTDRVLRCEQVANPSLEEETALITIYATFLRDNHSPFSSYDEKSYSKYRCRWLRIIKSCILNGENA